MAVSILECQELWRGSQGGVQWRWNGETQCLRNQAHVDVWTFRVMTFFFRLQSHVMHRLLHAKSAFVSLCMHDTP
jgi:hypothetical protein